MFLNLITMYDTKKSIKEELNNLIQQFYNSDTDEDKIHFSKKVWATLFSIPYSDADKKNLEKAFSAWAYEMQLYLDDKSEFNSLQVSHNFRSAVLTVDTSLLED